MVVLAIDPGPVQSAFIFWNGEVILDKGLVENNKLLDILSVSYPQVEALAVEMIASYGMGVGKDVFETCVWIGRFIDRWKTSGNKNHRLIYRREVKMHLCESMRAKDQNIRIALIDRFAPGFRNHGKGTKRDPSIFYGFKADLWQAMAVAVYAWDTKNLEGI